MLLFLWKQKQNKTNKQQTKTTKKQTKPQHIWILFTVFNLAYSEYLAASQLFRKVVTQIVTAIAKNHTKNLFFAITWELCLKC